MDRNSYAASVTVTDRRRQQNDAFFRSFEAAGRMAAGSCLKYRQRRQPAARLCCVIRITEPPP
jgi:hypothetical protein